MLTTIIAGITVILLLLASYFDLRTGEIPERLTRGLIVFIIVTSAMYSLYTFNHSFILNSTIMGAGFFIFGYVMFYLGEWGGGDVKLLAGVGCSLGLLGSMNYFTEAPFSSYLEGVFPYYIDYFINLAIASSPYVILYSLILGLLKPRVFKEFASYFRKKIFLMLIPASFLPSIVALSLGMDRMALIYLSVPVLVLISIYLKAVEEIALKKTIDVDELREEDILASDIIVDGRRIAHKRDMGGISGSQLLVIRGLASEGKIPRNIAVRWGVRFAPILFLAFLLTLIYGDVLEILVKSLVV